MTPEDFKQSFSMPLNGSMYEKPPYVYRAVQDLIITYEAETDAVCHLLPPHVEPADDPVICAAWARWVPFSAFGPYHEAYVMVRAVVDGIHYLYQPVILVDSEIPLGAGREIWGYAKKLAHFERGWGDNGPPYGEQLLFTVDRPRGQRLMTASLICDRKAAPQELGEDLPVLSCRVIPSAESAERPSVAELVRLDVDAHIHKSADGSHELYAGRAHLEFKGGAADPWHLLAPKRILGGFFTLLDFDLGFGKVIHDYLDDPEVWG